MGSSSSKVSTKDIGEVQGNKTHTGYYARNGNNITSMQAMFDKNCNVPFDVQIAHYTPSGFPLIPVVSKQTQRRCQESWDKIISDSSLGDQKKSGSGTEMSGITKFYTEFYERLESFDSSKKIEAVLAAHSTGKNKIAAKGEILIRIVKFALSIDGDTPAVQLQLYLLGKSHCRKMIRPWQYSVFVQALLYTISTRLGSDASHEVMEAWVNTFAFILKSMLPQAIKGQVVENEMFINTSSAFASLLTDDDQSISKVRGDKHSKKPSQIGSTTDLTSPGH